MRPVRRMLLVAALVLVPAVAVGMWLATTSGDDAPPAPTLPAPSAPLLPDLVVTPLSDFQLAWRSDGTREIFFTATVANVGRGPFAVHAARSEGGDRWLVTQRFREPDGSLAETVVPDADLVFGGHGHSHWHIRIGASYRLVAKGEDEPVRSLVKAGYCFFDQRLYRPELPGAPSERVFPASGCSGTETTDLDMGLSVGWSDPYTWLLPDQRLDVTGLPYGDYRLYATADPDRWFREVTEANNVAWADLRLRARPDGAPVVDVLDLSPEPS